MKALFITIAILLFSLLMAQDFTQTYCFDGGIDNGFIVRSENEGMYHYRPTGTAGSIQTMPLEDWLWGWKQGTIPTAGYVGFSRMAPDPLVNPMFNETEPTIYFYTPLETDPIGDNQFSTNTNLDIVSSRISFTNDRLYFAMKTANESYPVSSGFTYFAYMPVIVNPDANPADNPPVFGLMYTVSLGTVISPGLYKVVGTGFDGLTRLGDITFSIEDNYLILSCDIDDLLVDPDFYSWFNPEYPVFATTTTTSRITLTGGTQQADITAGAKILLKPNYIDPVNTHAPVLSNIDYTISDAGGYTLALSVNYFDADLNVPREAYITIDEGEEIPLLPLSTDNLDFSQPVIYGASSIPIGLDWDEIRIVFSDGIGYVQHLIQNPVANSDLVQIPEMSIYPNPVRNTLNIKGDEMGVARLSLYNLRGQKVADMQISKEDSSIDMSDFCPGIYILKTDKGFSKRIMKM